MGYMIVHACMQTIAVSARGLDGSLQYDTHNLYGLAWTLANFQALRAIRSKRPFILTRCALLSARGPAHALQNAVGRCCMLPSLHGPAARGCPRDNGSPPQRGWAFL